MNAYFQSSALKAATVVNAIEIDFLPVGEKSKSGDAIAIRYGEVGGVHQVMVVDGGCLTAGDNLVAHLRECYGNNVVVTHAVCTHSDGDHASGLRRVIEELPVMNLWVHQPWNHVSYLNPSFKGNWSDENLAWHLRHDCFPIISDLCDLAEEKGVPLREPFAGEIIGPFTVLAPSMSRYLGLVPDMDQTPVTKAQDSFIMDVIRKAMASVFGTAEAWGIETLKDPAADATSVPNETSVVLFSHVNDKRMLLTADAGVGALNEAVAVAEHLSLNILSPDLIQMPHHGSRHNVGPTILNAILGEKLWSENGMRGWAIASCAKECLKKPYRSVTNAFRRRGYKTGQTKGSLINWRVGYDLRPGLSGVPEIPFYPMVED